MRRLLLLFALLLSGCGAAAAGPVEPSGTLFMSGRDPGVLISVDAATASVHEREGVRQMSGGDPPYFVHYTGGRLVTFALGRASSFAPDLTHPKSLGEAWFWVPSATPGRIWTILRTPGSNVTFRGVREVGVDGRVLFARRWKVPGWPLGAVTDGIVVQRHARLEVWSPVTRKRVRRLPGEFPVAFRGNVVASERDGTLFIDDRPIPGKFAMPWAGAFSPDGTLLALPATRQRVAVVNVASGMVSLIGGARTAKAYPSMTWASSGWLFWSAGGGDIGAWRVGSRARLLGVDAGKFIGMTSD